MASTNRLNSFGLKSPKNGCEIWFIHSRANGEEEGHLEGGLLGREGTLSTKRCWNHWWLELWTGGTYQLPLHVGAQLLGHTLDMDCAMWQKGDLVCKGELRPNPCEVAGTADSPCACLHSACNNPLQKSWAQPLSDAQQLVLPAVPLWNFLVDHHFTESFIVPMAKGYHSNSKAVFPVTPWCLPSSILYMSTALTDKFLPLVHFLCRAHLKLSIEYHFSFESPTFS